MATAGRNSEAWICCQGFSGMQLLLGWWHRMVEEVLGLAVHAAHPQVRLRTPEAGLWELACWRQGVSAVRRVWDGEHIQLHAELCTRTSTQGSAQVGTPGSKASLQIRFPGVENHCQSVEIMKLLLTCGVRNAPCSPLWVTT